MSWSRADKLALVGVAMALVAMFASLFTPEIRALLGLSDAHAKAAQPILRIPFLVFVGRAITIIMIVAVIIRALQFLGEKRPFEERTQAVALTFMFGVFVPGFWGALVLKAEPDLAKLAHWLGFAVQHDFGGGLSMFAYCAAIAGSQYYIWTERPSFDA